MGCGESKDAAVQMELICSEDGVVPMPVSLS